MKNYSDKSYLFISGNEKVNTDIESNIIISQNKKVLSGTASNSKLISEY